ncbi:MAG: class I SAM-dependent methyltransferase [Chitinophagales bacterium]
MEENTTQDKYVHGMDWGQGEVSLSDLNNYRKYQYDLVAKYVGKEILEVGSGSRGFTKQILNENADLNKIVSIEPSVQLHKLYKDKYPFPDFVSSACKDIFELDASDFGTFDTIFFIHVLEHIEKDKAALDHTHSLLSKDGYVLIEVPALQWLFSGHDEMLGHYRRYNKSMMKNIIDPNKYDIVKLWYQDPIGVLGSLFFFKLRKIKLKSDQGRDLVSKQGGIYDKYIIPFEKQIEKFITFPFGLSLTAVLKKK